MIYSQSRYTLLFLAVAAAVAMVSVWAAALPKAQDSPNVVATAIALDLVVVLPLLYYFLLVRRNAVPSLTIVPVFLLAMVCFRLIVPEDNRGHLAWLGWVVLLAELALACLVLFKVRALVRQVRLAQATSIYAVDALQIGMTRVIGYPALAHLLAAEVALFYFAVMGWFQTFRLRLSDSLVFSYHRRQNLGGVLLALLLVATVEASLVHLVVLQWSATVAWILLGVHLYGFVWVVGFYHSTRLQPIVLSPLDLHLRAGMHWRVVVPRSSIVKADRATLSDARRKHVVNLSVLGSPNVILEVGEPIRVQGMFGMKKEAQTLGISVDDPVGFLDALGLGPAPSKPREANSQ